MENTSNYTMSGQKLNIITYPSSNLAKVAEEVEIFNDEINKLCQNMLYTMYHAPGIGLAAPQVGVNKRIFVIDVDFKIEENDDGATSYTNLNPRIFINPTINNKSGEIESEEGCLSLPGLYEKVKRYQDINIDYFDQLGNQHQLKATELLSICIQHENDHLDGKVFIDRLSLIKKSLLRKKFIKSRK